MKIANLFLIFAVCLRLTIPAATVKLHGSTITAKAADSNIPIIQQHSNTLTPDVAGWNTPTVIYKEEWDDPLFFCLDDSATRLVALIPNSGNNDNNRHIVVSEYTSGAWQTPVLIAQNGSYSYDLYQVLPQQTHPVISGDGNTIAYVGYTGTTFGAYIVNRLPGGGWDTPQLLSTGLANTHYWISLSQDGNTLTLCDYPFFDLQKVYVLTRSSGVWGAPQLIGVGGNPSLSQNGKKLAYVSNSRVAFAELIAGSWTVPQELTDNDPGEFSAEYPQMSRDGRAIHYWLVTLIPEETTLIRTAQDLYIMWRDGSGWSASEKVNSSPIEPSFVTEGPAAANLYATRLIYSRPITTTEPSDGSIHIYDSQLETSEWITGTWQTTTLVESTGFGNFNKWPFLTPNGKTLVFDGGTRYFDGDYVNNALWQITTDSAPQFPPWAFSITTLFGSEGGSLFSAFDSIHYLFGSGTFSDTVEFTHSFWPNPPAPPYGMGGIGGIGGFSGLGGSFSSSMFGPGGLPVQPSLPVTVTVNYGNTDTGGTITSTLGLWSWNTGMWESIPSFNDPVRQVLTATVGHFSYFAVFGETYQIFLPVVIRR